LCLHDSTTKNDAISVALVVITGRDMVLNEQLALVLLIVGELETIRHSAAERRLEGFHSVLGHRRRSRGSAGSGASNH